jgi:hypothetical protein
MVPRTVAARGVVVCGATLELGMVKGEISEWKRDVQGIINQTRIERVAEPVS